MGQRFIAIEPSSLSYFAVAFYSALPAVYFWTGVYPSAAPPAKDALFQSSLAFGFSRELVLGVAGAVVLAGLLATARFSRSMWIASSSLLLAFILFATAARGFQQYWLKDQLAALPALIGTLPAIVLLAWSARASERHAGLFGRINSQMDRWALVVSEHRVLRRTIASWLLLMIGTVTLAGFVYLTLNQYWRIEARYDTAHNENMFFHAIRGQIIWESLDRINHLGRHFTPTLFLNLPIYAVFPHAMTFLVLESLFLVLAGIPLYLLAHRITQSQTAAFVFTLAYLAFPHTYGMNIHGFKELCMWPLIGFAYLLQLEQPEFHRRPAFWLLLVLAVGLKEEIALTIAGVSAVQWLQGRSRGWNLAVMGFCAIWFLTVTQIVMPWLQGPGGDPEYGKGFLYAQYYADMVPAGAKSLVTFGTNAFLHPSLTAQILTRPQALKFLLDISWPLLFLPWFSGLKLISLVPNLFLTNLLSSRAGLTSTLSSYITYVVPWFYCALYGWNAVHQRFAHKSSQWQAGFLYALLAVTLLGLTQTVRIPPGVTPQQRNLRAWLESRPPELRVMASRCFLPHLSGRDSIRTMNASEDLSQLDLIVVQSTQVFCSWTEDPFAQIQQAVAATGDFIEDPSPQPGVVVYRRVRHPR